MKTSAIFQGFKNSRKETLNGETDFLITQQNLVSGARLPWYQLILLRRPRYIDKGDK